MIYTSGHPFLRNMREGVDLIKVEVSDHITFINMRHMKGIFAKTNQKTGSLPHMFTSGPVVKLGTNDLGPVWFPGPVVFHHLVTKLVLHRKSPAC